MLACQGMLFEKHCFNCCSTLFRHGLSLPMIYCCLPIQLGVFQSFFIRNAFASKHNLLLEPDVRHTTSNLAQLTANGQLCRLPTVRAGRIVVKIWLHLKLQLKQQSVIQKESFRESNIDHQNFYMIAFSASRSLLSTKIMLQT